MDRTWSEVKTWKEAKQELKSYLDKDKRSHYEIFKQAKLSRNTYYKLFSDERINMPMRKATIERLAEALNLTYTFPFGDVPHFEFEADSTMPDISDEGLLELFHPDNCLKHAITDQEIKALSHIQQSRSSNSTMAQWVTILYAIRGLDTT